MSIVVLPKTGPPLYLTLDGVSDILLAPSNIPDLPPFDKFSLGETLSFAGWFISGD